VTVAWTAEPPGLFGHPEALLNAAASRVDLNVVLKAEPKGTDEHERLPRILFFPDRRAVFGIGHDYM
jgi:hypothetical protein